MQLAWTGGQGELEFDLLMDLNVALDELRVLMKARKALCDEGLRGVLDVLKSMRDSYVRVWDCVNIL